MTESTPFLDFHATKWLHTAQGKELLDIRFQLQKGNTLALYGPSGAGKTTLLRILAGLTDVTTGHIRLGDETWLDTKNRINWLTRRRAIGFVFQDFALFPNLSVREQLEYALPGNAEDQDTALIDELLFLMELEALQHLRPALLSGGQQQRVALARAIARRPGLLLLDEPLSALDEEMRNKLQEYILKVQQRYHLTTVLVSHHLPEIIHLADTVISIKKGRIESDGPPAVIFAQSHPLSPTSISLPAIVLAIQPAGDNHILTVRCADTTLDVQVTGQQAAPLSIGHTVTVSFNASDPALR